jgi:hypothetical protein
MSMSTISRRIVPLALAWTTLALLAGGAAAQSRDPLPEVRERLKIEAQRVNKEVQDGRMKAYRLLRSDPEGSVEILKRLTRMLRDDTSLSEESRTTLLRTLARDIENVRALSSIRRTTEPAAAASRIEARRATTMPAADAQRSVYDAATARIREVQARSNQARDLRTTRGDRLTGTIAQVDKSAVPAGSDYELPADWAEKSKRRSAAMKMTEQEKAILNSLTKLLKVDFDKETLQSVIDDLSRQMGQNILLDKQSLDEANVTYDTPITLRFNKPVTARTALKRVLADVGLTYVIRKEAIEVTTLARAREMMTTRTYYIGDLIGIASPMLPAIANQFQMVQAIGIIINQIKGIDPESWEGRGGPGTIAFDPVRMALIIKQSAEVHYMLNSSR